MFGVPRRDRKTRAAHAPDAMQAAPGGLMPGLMQHWPLTLDKILDHAKIWHGAREIVTRSVDGPITRTTYAALHQRAKSLSNALLGLGLRPGDRVASLAWNTDRHLELWYAAMGVGMICHTVNPRLFAAQICYILNHARSRVLFVDASFLPILAEHRAKLAHVEHVVLLSGEASAAGFEALGYEDLIAAHAPDCRWGGFDENTAAGLCYTSGTTGDPKGVLYSHRSNFLLAMQTMQADVLAISARDCVLPIVPMFHANAWGIAFGAPAAGAKLVMPGARLDGASLYELIETEGVTASAAVPTVCQALLDHLDRAGARLSTLRRLVIGGAACPDALMRGFDRHGVDVIHAWGMTELSPVGTVCAPTAEPLALAEPERLAMRLTQGRPPLGIELKLADDAGAARPHDGAAAGRLMARGPTVAAGYFGREGDDILDSDGFFDTGDVAIIDARGFMRITDRAKDVIKSGGEWISSIEIENIAIGHPSAASAAVIGVAHPKWTERPLLIVQLKPGAEARKEDFLAFLDGKIAKWWMPDDVLFIESMPLGATGKIDKLALRRSFGTHLSPDASSASHP